MRAWLDTWTNVARQYAWVVDLSHFGQRHRYPGFFHRVIGPRELVSFEDAYRHAIDDDGSYVVAGEVCYWKNYGSFQSRDRLADRLLQLLSDRECWTGFRNAVREVRNCPGFPALRRLQEASGQPRGFATPVTFVAFYDPASYPMVDKHIATWWAQNKGRFGLDSAPAFAQRADGWIETTSARKVRHNWEAYWAWTRFCRDYAQRMGGWRSRDIEMTVWTAQKRGAFLPTLPV